MKLHKIMTAPAPYLFNACGIKGAVACPPRWSRVGGNNCPNCASNYGEVACGDSVGPYTTYELDQRRKVEILKYKKNSAQMSKAQQYSMASRNALTRKKSWATQTQTHTDPNVDKLPEIQNEGVTVALKCNQPIVPCSLTSDCDVPGPVIPLCIDESVPLYNYKMQLSYPSGGKEGITGLPIVCGFEPMPPLVPPLPPYPSDWIDSTGFPVPLTSIAYFRSPGGDQYNPPRNWTSYYETISINGTLTVCCVIESNDGTSILKWVVWWDTSNMSGPVAAVPKIRGFSYTTNPQGDINDHPVMYAYGSFNRVQVYSSTITSGVICGCVAQFINISYDLCQITNNPGNVGDTGVYLNAVDPTLAIVNDMVVLPNGGANIAGLYFLLVGYFTNYVLSNGTIDTAVPLQNMTILTPPPLNYVGNPPTQITAVSWMLDATGEDYGTNGEIYGALYEYGTTFETYVVGNFTTAGIAHTYHANGYAKFIFNNYNPQSITTLTDALPVGSVMRGISVSGTDSTKKLIYGGTSATSGAFAYSVVAATGNNTLLTLPGLPTNYVGGLNGLAYGPIPAQMGSYDVLGLFNPTANSYMMFWCSNDLITWGPLSYNPANNGDTPTTNATGQGLLYNGTTLYMNAANNSTGNTYFKYLT